MQTNKDFGNTPLPYKGMNIKAEIASRIMPEIIRLHHEGSIIHIDEPSMVDAIVETTILYAEALVKRLNSQE